MTPKEARQLLVKIGRSDKYKIIPERDSFNFYRLLDRVYEILTKEKPKDLGIGSESKVITLFFGDTYMNQNNECALKKGTGVNLTMRRKEKTFKQILDEIEAL